MDKKEFKFQYQSYSSLTELTSTDANLLTEAKEAIKTSYSPYSQFAVGAAVLLANGKIVKGSNQENAAYPSGLCAERVALFSAASQYPGIAVESIAIAINAKNHNTDSPIAPCGACRQVMIEYEHLHQHPMRVIMHGEGGNINAIDQARDLLPFDFHADHLKK
jgi:cytidine deaminase